MMSDRTLLISSCTHPFFKLRWISNSSLRLYATELVRDEVSAAANSQLFSVTSPNNVSDDFFNFPTSSVLSRDNEINFYFSDPNTDLESLNRYPTLKNIFLKFNCATPSSAPVERLFSAASLVRTARRNRLSDRHFEMLLLLKINKNF